MSGLSAMRVPITTCLNSIALVTAASLLAPANVTSPEEFLREKMQLSPEQVTDIQKGKAVAKILSSSKPSDIYVFGAVYVHARPDAYLQFMQDMNRLKNVSGYLGVGAFSTPPT